MGENQGKYPASLSVDYPEKPLNRLTTFFRPITVIPIAIILGLLSGSSFEYTIDNTAYEMAAGGGVLFLALVLMILFRQKYPKWWFDWNLALTKFSCRVGVYMLLLRDEYPSTDEEQAVHIELKYPTKTTTGPRVKWFRRPPLYAGCSSFCRINLRTHRLVCHSLYGQISARPFQLRYRSNALGLEGQRLCLPLDYR